MKSVLKAVAPVAVTITLAVSGIAMADTAPQTEKSADTATTTVKESAKPAIHKHHEVSADAAKKVDAAATQSAATSGAVEKAATDLSVEKKKPVEKEKSAAIDKATEKVPTTVAATDKAAAKIEPSKVADASKAVETTKTK